MVRHADTEMIVRKEEVYTHESLATGATTGLRGHVENGQEG